MTMAHSLQMLAQVSADQIVNCLVQGGAIALLAWAVLRVSGRTGAVTRFAVWLSALLAITVLPLAGFVGRSLETTPSSVDRTLTLPYSWAVYLFAAWALIAGFAVLKVTHGLCRIWVLRRSCRPLDPQTLDPLLQQTLQAFDSRRAVTLCTSESLNVPAAIGFFKPAVVFPAWALEELSVAEFNSILLHELGHLARWDDWTNLAQKLARAVLFFHPAIWWIDSKLSLEREMACDDIVLARTASPRAYAECLVSLTEKGLLHRGFNLVQAAISRMRETTLRVTQILDRNHAGATKVGKPVCGLLVVAAFGVTAVSPMAPHLVSFDGVAPENVNASIAAHSRNTAHFENAAFHPAPNSSGKLTLVNAAFHPDELSTAPSAQTVSQVRPKRVRATAVRQALASSLRTPNLGSRNVSRERSAGITNVRAAAPAEVFLVVMQEHVYNARGQSLLTLSVYRLTTVQSDPVRTVSPKKI